MSVKSKTPKNTPNSVNYFTHQKRLCVMSHSFGSPHQPQIKPIPFTTKPIAPKIVLSLLTLKVPASKQLYSVYIYYFLYMLPYMRYGFWVKRKVLIWERFGLVDISRLYFTRKPKFNPLPVMILIIIWFCSNKSCID